MQITGVRGDLLLALSTAGERFVTPRQVESVRRSFAKVLPIRTEAAALFYDRRFTIDPSTGALFRGDMAAQGAKLISAIAMVVNGLDRLDSVIESVRALGRRHVQYGVAEHHCGTVGEALLWTLEQGLGKQEFTLEVREAWAAAYVELSHAMIGAAREA